jgi:hypothetical protein
MGMIARPMPTKDPFSTNLANCPSSISHSDSTPSTSRAHSSCPDKKAKCAPADINGFMWAVPTSSLTWELSRLELCIVKRMDDIGDVRMVMGAQRLLSVIG